MLLVKGTPTPPSKRKESSFKITAGTLFRWRPILQPSSSNSLQKPTHLPMELTKQLKLLQAPCRRPSHRKRRVEPGSWTLRIRKVMLRMVGRVGPKSRHTK